MDFYCLNGVPHWEFNSVTDILMKRQPFLLSGLGCVPPPSPLGDGYGNSCHGSDVNPPSPSKETGSPPLGWWISILSVPSGSCHPTRTGDSAPGVFFIFYFYLVASTPFLGMSGYYPWNPMGSWRKRPVVFDKPMGPHGDSHEYHLMPTLEVRLLTDRDRQNRNVDSIDHSWRTLVSRVP